jgi:hypothetical protein
MKILYLLYDAADSLLPAGRTLEGLVRGHIVLATWNVEKLCPVKFSLLDHLDFRPEEAVMEGFSVRTGFKEEVLFLSFLFAEIQSVAIAQPVVIRHERAVSLCL